MKDNELIKFFDTYPFPGVLDVPELIEKGMRETFDLVSDKEIIFPENPKFKVNNVLIVGCGYNEALYHALRNPKITFTACDISKKVIDYNVEISSKLKLKNINFVHSDYLKLKDNNFDAIYAKNVLTYSKDIKIALNGLNKLLSSEGALLLSVPNGYHFQYFDILRPLFKDIGVDIYDSESVNEAFKIVQGLNNFHPSKILITDKDKFIPIDNFICYHLSPIFNHFTIIEIFKICKAAGFVFQNWYDNSLYFPSATIRDNATDHPNLYKKLDSLGFEKKWDGLCRIFGHGRGHFFHTMCLRKNNKNSFFPYKLLNNEDSVGSINPNQKIVTHEGTSTKHVIRANFRMQLTPIQEIILESFKKPNMISKVIKKMEKDHNNEIVQAEIIKLTESSILRIHL